MVTNSSSPPHTAWAASVSKFPEKTDRSAEEPPGLVVEQVVAPIHHPLQGTVPISLAGVARTAAETVDPAGGRSRPGSWPPCAPRPARWLSGMPSRCWQIRSTASRFSPSATNDGRKADGPIHKQHHRLVGHRQRGHRHHPFTRDDAAVLDWWPTPSTRGRRPAGRPPAPRHGSDQVLAVVHDQQGPPRTDHLQQLLAGVGHRRRPSGPGWPASTPPARRDG